MRAGAPAIMCMVLELVRREGGRGGGGGGGVPAEEQRNRSLLHMRELAKLQVLLERLSLQPRASAERLPVPWLIRKYSCS